MSGKSASTQNYNIKQVEVTTGLTRRTIHFYVKEGLIPPPEGLGRSARYSDDHVLRLELIRRLKSSTHLRLEGIREIIEPLTTAELREYIEDIAASKSRTAASVPTAGAPEGLDDVTPPTAPIPAETLDLSGFAESAPDPEELLEVAVNRDAAPEGADAATSKAHHIDTDTWTRVRVTKDIELHFRPCGDHRFADRLRRVIAFARRIFS
jgi:DNA-binding transcriptional MerR regulator